MFAITPKLDCPHINENQILDPNSWTISELDSPVASFRIDSPCEVCQDNTENWICLGCQKVFCSRYIQGHAQDHFQQEGHCLMISFSDLSIWCYGCESYVKHDVFSPSRECVYFAKFHELPPDSAMHRLGIEESKTEPSLQQLLIALESLPTVVISSRPTDDTTSSGTGANDTTSSGTSNSSDPSGYVLDDCSICHVSGLNDNNNNNNNNNNSATAKLSHDHDIFTPEKIDNVPNLVYFVVQNAYLGSNDATLKHRSIGIPMGTNAAPELFTPT